MAYLTIGQQILQILKDNFGSGMFRAYYFGDPQLLAKDNLPAIVVEESTGTTTVDYTGMDTEEKTIQIKVIFDKREDWGASPDVDTTFAKIRDIIDGRDSISGQYLEKTLKGILRTSFTLSNPGAGTGIQPYAVNQTMKTAYYLEQRPENTFTQEGRLTMMVTELIPVPNRF